MIQLAALWEHFAEPREKLALVQAGLDQAVDAIRSDESMSGDDRLAALAKVVLAARAEVCAIRAGLGKDCRAGVERLLLGLSATATAEEVSSAREFDYAVAAHGGWHVEIAEQIALRLREPNELRSFVLTSDLQRLVRKATTATKLDPTPPGRLGPRRGVA